MLDRADLFRADAGLPPLTGDAQVSLASRNHSSYTAQNPTQASEDPHFEVAGLPGATGFSPGDRCAAVGAFCNSEVMYSPGFPDPVGGWLATIYHRPLVGSPEAGIVGAGEVADGWATMDSRATVNTAVGPFGYPTGRWRGSSGFSGETPDPVAACNGEGKPLSYPVGIAVSLYLPNRKGKVTAIHVHRQGELADLPGCLLEGDTEAGKAMGTLVLDDPLQAGGTYEVSAIWNPGPDELESGASRPSADLTYSWSFHFETDEVPGVDESSVGRPCRGLALRRVASVAPPRRSRGAVPGIELKLGLSRKGSMRLDAAGLRYRLGRHRHAVQLKLGGLAHRTVTLGRSVDYLRLRLPRPLAKKLSHATGPRIHLRLAGRGEACADLAKFQRVEAVRPGWVRMKGQAEWSAHAPRLKKQHRRKSARSSK